MLRQRLQAYVGAVVRSAACLLMVLLLAGLTHQPPGFAETSEEAPIEVPAEEGDLALESLSTAPTRQRLTRLPRDFIAWSCSTAKSESSDSFSCRIDDACRTLPATIKRGHMLALGLNAPLLI